MKLGVVKNIGAVKHFNVNWHLPSSELITPPPSLNNVYVIVGIENLDPEFKDTFTSLSISECSDGGNTFEKDIVPIGGYLIGKSNF